MERMRNVVLGPLYNLRVEDLRDWHVVEVNCAKCGRTSPVYPATLRRYAEPHERLVDLQRRLTCRRCHNKRENEWRIMEISRNA